MDTVANFHWLHASERIKFKLAVLVYRALHVTTPQYLSEELCYVADMPARGHLQSSTSSLGWMSDRHTSLLLVTVHLPQLVPGFGTVFLKMSAISY